MDNNMVSFEENYDSLGQESIVEQALKDNVQLKLKAN